MEERLLELLRIAIKYSATDIHFSLRYNEITIDMRINGKFNRVKSKYGDNKLIRYLQYLANLDIGNLLDPQTGQFEMEVDDSLLSLRFAVINTVSYTNGVLRILNSNIKLDVNNLSLLQEQNNYFKSLLNEYSGLVIFSGPTGSGKTTTLYTLLKSCKNKKIFTIEDPIEVYNDDFIQIQVNVAANLGYEEAVSQVLRHDPDILMIGEIREEKAAKMAVQSSNTGHLVLTTVHASSSSSVISRLVELGVNEDYLYENLLCLVNQRMMIDKNNQKIVVYEVMDKDEIEFFRKTKTNSNGFLSIKKQIEKGINNGIFKEAVK